MISKMAILIFLSITILSCSREVTYQIDHDPILIPQNTKLLIAYRLDTSDVSHLKKKERRKIAFDRATKAYFYDRLIARFSSDDNFKQVEDSIINGDFDTLKANIDLDIYLLSPILGLSKSDGFTISSDEENTNYSTYYGAFNAFIYKSSQLFKRTSIEDNVRVQGDEFVPLIDAFASQSLRFAVEIEEMLDQFVEEYHKRWYPWTQVITKEAYIGGKFKDFNTYFNKGDYVESLKIVEPYLESDNKSLQMKASYNMYLICEAQRDPECSQKWLTNYEKCKKEVEAQWQNER